MTILKQTYQGYVLPALEYGMAAWGSCSNNQLEKLNKVHNQGLRMITGAVKSTPIADMETLTGLQSLPERRDSKVLAQYAKIKSQRHQPLHKRAKNNKTRRLKRSHFIDNAQKIEENLKLQDVNVVETANITSISPPWEENKLPTIITHVKGISSKQQNEREQLKQIATDYIEELFPKTEWTRVYTDRSAKDATTDGGAGIHAEWPDARTMSISIPGGRWCNNYRAEALAIQEAAKALMEEEDTYNSQIVFLSDAKSVLDALRNPKNTELNDLRLALIKLRETAKEVTLQWIPGHCDIEGNEKADTLAKSGAESMQFENLVTHEEKKTAIRASVRNQWHERHPKFKREDPIHKLERANQVQIFRLRTGHNLLRDHMFRTFKIGNTATCECGQEPENAEHVLQRCLRYDEQRTAVWPGGAPLREKLYGDLEELGRTVVFLRQIGLRL